MANGNVRKLSYFTRVLCRFPGLVVGKDCLYTAAQQCTIIGLSENQV